MNDTIRKTITELFESKDKKVTFDLDEDTIVLKVDKVVKLVNDIKVDICYELTAYIRMAEYTLTLSPAEYNVDYILKYLNFIINNDKNRREEFEKDKYWNAKLKIFVDNEEEVSNNEKR